MQRLLDAPIATRRGIILAHQERAYGSSHLREPLCSSETASRRSVLLPLAAAAAKKSNNLSPVRRVHALGQQLGLTSAVPR